MKIYHLNIKDTEDQEFDMHLHFGHDTKTATDLWEDYTNAYSDVIDNLNNWNIKDVISRLENMGWVPVMIEKVDVEY